MSVTRKMLKAMGIEEDKIDQIIEAHRESVDAVAEERDKYKEQAEKLANVEKDLVKANAKLEDLADASEKLKNLQKEYDGYRADVEAKATKAEKARMYKELLTKAGIPEKRQDAILKVTNLDDVKVGKDGKLENAKELSESINQEWADFKVTEKIKGADIFNPPSSTGGMPKTREEIMAIKDTSARQKAWDELLSYERSR